MSLSSLVESREQSQQEKVGNPGRRTFIKTLGAVSAAAASVAQGPFVWAQGQTYNWRMATTWPRGLAIFHDGAERFAKIVEERSGGRLRIKVYAAGELVPPFETFNAVSQGKAEAGHSVSFYWEEKIPAAPWFSAVPFGFNAQGINAWMYAGGGIKLWEEVYAPLNTDFRATRDGDRCQ